MAGISIPLSNLEQAVSTNGKSLTYAVLHSLFSMTERSKNPIRDVYDSYIPFVRSACRKQSGRQIDLEILKIDLNNDFGLDIPVYTIENMLPTLRADGVIVYDNIAKLYIVANAIDDDKSDVVISEKITEIERALDLFIDNRDARDVIISGNPVDAFINFLKPSRDSDKKTVSFKKVLVSDPIELERYLIAEFIKFAHDQDSVLYEAITHVFVGVLIEEFTSTISTVGSNQDFSKLKIFYDTSLLLRLLGTSGTLLETASIELHRYLEGLNISTEFFANNEQEVANILSAIIASKDGGYGIYGETGEAIIRGEITTSEIRSMEYTFVERLAQKGVFPSKYEQSGFQKNVRGQIDEAAFSKYLMSSAKARNRSYSQENADHDAISLAHVVRMRRTQVVRDVAECPAIFITSNRLLAASARQFLVEEGHLRNFEVPPIMHVSQASTIFWLAKDGDISERNASQELMANCYEAMRPDSNFYTELFNVVGAYRDLDNIDSTLLASVKRIARQDSFGKTAILRVLSAADILARAEEAVQEGVRRAQEEKIQAKAEGELSGRLGYSEELQETHQNRCRNIANTLVFWGEILASLGVILFLIIDAFSLFSEWTPIWLIGKLAASVVVLLSVLDYFSISVIRKWTDSFRSKIANKLYRTLYA